MPCELCIFNADWVLLTCFYIACQIGVSYTVAICAVQDGVAIEDDAQEIVVECVNM